MGKGGSSFNQFTKYFRKVIRKGALGWKMIFSCRSKNYREQLEFVDSGFGIRQKFFIFWVTTRISGRIPQNPTFEHSE